MWMIWFYSHSRQTARLHHPLRGLISATPANCERRPNQRRQAVHQYRHPKECQLSPSLEGHPREIYCIPTATSPACSERGRHQGTSPIFCTSMSATLCLLFRMANSCSSVQPCRTPVRPLVSATNPLGSLITCCKTSAWSFRSAFGLLRLPRMPCATAPCR